MMLTNAKFADWMRSFSELEPPKLKSRTTFQWMENDIIPFWLFPNDTDRILDIEDDQYFDEYIDYHSISKSHQRYDKILFCIFLFSNLCQLLRSGESKSKALLLHLLETCLNQLEILDWSSLKLET